MNDVIRKEIERAADWAARSDVHEDEVYAVVQQRFTKHAVELSATAGARSASVVRDTLSIPCEVWRDPTQDRETFMVRFPWGREGVPHTRKGFERWFGSEVAESVP